MIGRTINNGAPDPTQAPPLTRRFKLAYGVGSMAEAVVISSTTQFLMLFYNQVRGLPSERVGMAIAAGLAVNAIVDPVVGSWSDRTRSRFGRRHPFMALAIVPVALTFFALFNPPTHSGQFVQLAWLAGLNILLQQALTAFHTPHLALGGELTTDYIGRMRVMSYNTFFLWAGDTLCWVATFYTATFFWQLTNAQITWFALGSFVSYSCDSLIVAWMHRRFDKRYTGAAAVVYCIGPAMPLAFGWAGVLSARTPGILAILIGFSLLQHLPFSLMTTTMFSALADIADENELRFGERQEGVLLSTQTFFSRIDQAVGAALAGWVLYLISFPVMAVPGHVTHRHCMGLRRPSCFQPCPGLPPPSSTRSSV